MHQEVERLDEAGILRSVRVGRTRLVRPDERSPYHEELRSLVLKAFGPVPVLHGVLAGVEGIQHAHVFGSWARRYHGEPGPAPRDIDVLVVGDPIPDAVYDACRQAEATLQAEVNVTILSQDEWESGTSGLLTAIREGPLVTIGGA